MQEPRFSGPEYKPRRDFERLTKQHERVREAMRDGKWRTVAQISRITGDPENSVQAQLRHLRKPRFGGWIVSKRTAYGGLWEYHLRERTEADKPYEGGKSATALAARVAELEEAIRDAAHLLQGGPLMVLVARQKLEKIL